ncbi:MAG TPA: spirocyclase AveC family protein [Nevskiaceae bacterium]|nr:spirocyclase AveC family protein [Nevskiaceae bacterium]
MTTRPLKTTWGFAHYLALFGTLMLMVQTWTWIGWWIGGPFSITEFKTPGSLNWWAARFYEVLFGCLFVFLLVWVTRRSLRERRLVFDAKLMIAGISLLWVDEWTNIASPIWSYSSNFVNLNNPLAGFPFAVNPDLGRLPFPILLHTFVYPCANLCAAIVVCAVMRKLLQWRPGQSTAQLLLTVAAIGVLFDIAFELPMFLLGLWAYPGTPNAFALFPGYAHKFPIWEMIPAGMAFAAFGALRFFKDDRGQELTERGLEHLSPRLRAFVSITALIGVLHIVWLASTSTQAIVGFYSAPYPPMPKYLINGMCDAPVLGGGQVTGTRYGQCPEEGLRFPIRYLPGDHPGSPYENPLDSP